MTGAREGVEFVEIDLETSRMRPSLLGLKRTVEVVVVQLPLSAASAARHKRFRSARRGIMVLVSVAVFGGIFALMSKAGRKLMESLLRASAPTLAAFIVAPVVALLVVAAVLELVLRPRFEPILIGIDGENLNLRIPSKAAWQALGDALTD